MKYFVLAVGLLLVVFLAHSVWWTYDSDCLHYPINDLKDLARVFAQSQMVKDGITQRNELRWCFMLGRFMRTVPI